MDIRYQYEIYIRPMDIWVLSMCRTYHSLVGACNLVFGAAMIFLTVRFWNQSNDWVQALLFLACLLVPVIQPLGAYWKAKAQAAMAPQGTRLTFAEDGIHVKLGESRDKIPWSQVKGIRKEAGMILVFTDRNHGYLLTNRVLKDQKQEFYDYVKEHSGMVFS